MILEILTIVLSAGLLWKGADWVVDAAAALARKFRVSELAIGLTVVAFGTSAPEFLVTATAAFKGLSDLSVANVAGSNLANLGLILGLMALIKPVVSEPRVLRRDGAVLMAVTVLAAGLAMGDALGRLAGFVLFGGLLVYLGWLFKTARMPANLEPCAETLEAHCGPATWKDYPKLAVGLAMVALGGNLLVDAARVVAVALGVSDWVIGLTVVALGTSLPELVTCLAASLKGQNSMLLGNLVGSNIFNLAGVLGLTCLMRPVDPSPAAIANLAWLVGFTALVLIFIRTGWKVSRVEGGILLAANLFLWARGAL